MRSYDELVKLKTFEERFNYLVLGDKVGEETFGSLRHVNQQFYRSREWRRVRDQVISRDLGCDMGLEGHEIVGTIVVHHINPIRPEDFAYRSPKLLDLNNLVCVSEETHRSIHYSGDLPTGSEFVVRRPNDTIPWKQ